MEFKRLIFVLAALAILVGAVSFAAAQDSSTIAKGLASAGVTDFFMVNSHNASEMGYMLVDTDDDRVADMVIADYDRDGNLDVFKIDSDDSSQMKCDASGNSTRSDGIMLSKECNYTVDADDDGINEAVISVNDKGEGLVSVDENDDGNVDYTVPLDSLPGRDSDLFNMTVSNCMSAQSLQNGLK